MENDFVDQFFQDIYEDVSLQLFVETSMAKQNELVHLNLFWGMFIQEFI